MSTVVRLHPVRTLVLGAEPAYRDRVAGVLGDLGPVSFALAALWESDELSDVLALVEHQHPDVVVLDATECEPAAERIATVLASAAPRTGVVIVCDHSTPRARRLGALPKWGWKQDLHRAVEQAYADGTRRPRGIRAAGPRRVAGPLAGWDEGAPAPPDA